MLVNSALHQSEAWRSQLTLAALALIGALPACNERPFEPPEVDCTPCGEWEGMSCVPCGPFVMGSDDAEADTGPERTVYLSSFAIDKTEVTQAAYQDCVDAGACEAPDEDCFESSEFWMGPERPVVCVSWFDAAGFCEWKDKRLPTEAEWEKAGRGEDGRLFPWGDTEPTCETAVTGHEGEDVGVIPCFWSAQDVGILSPAGDSPYGVSDMVGNVSEWVADWYAEDYYDDAPAGDPAGPETGERRSFRGTPWEPSRGEELSYRRAIPVDNSTYALGFRCARSAGEEWP